MLGARCGWTEHDGAYDLSAKDWDMARLGQFCMPETHFAHMQLFVEQACALVKGCDLAEIQAKAAAFAKQLQVPYYKWDPELAKKQKKAHKKREDDND